ncbi:unnamed protein product, partial [Polarella glacialis]
PGLAASRFRLRSLALLAFAAALHLELPFVWSPRWNRSSAWRAPQLLESGRTAALARSAAGQEEEASHHVNGASLGSPGGMFKAMEAEAQLASEIKIMSETMMTAAQEAREEVAERAESAGEASAYESALAEAFEAFDTDKDGQLTGEEVTMVLLVCGQKPPAELVGVLAGKSYRCSLEEFAMIYDQSETAEVPAAGDSQGDEDDDM